jgi:DNA-binding PadR family transcriptional regulator
MAKTAATRLEYALLGLIRQGVGSGYELRKQFASTPMGAFSDSPGSIYPALERLKRRGWIRPLTEGSGPRRRRVYGLTPAGDAAIKAWVRTRPQREEIARSPDDLLLRFSFMGRAAGRAAAIAFLQSLERLTAEYVRGLRGFLKTMPKEKVPTGRLALEQGIMQYETLARWARRALAELRRSK